MNVTINTEYREALLFEIDKFRFRITEGRLNKLKESRDPRTSIVRAIQKGLRLKTGTITGVEFDEAYKSIYEKITEEPYDQPVETVESSSSE